MEGGWMEERERERETEREETTRTLSILHTYIGMYNVLYITEWVG